MNTSPKWIKVYAQASFALALMAFVLLPQFAGAVTVGPTKLQISVDPGQEASGTLFLRNDDSERRTLYPSVQRFSVGADGQKIFSDDKSTIADWMVLPESVTLEAGADKQVPYQMLPPLDAAPGGHFAVIWWSTSPPSDGGQVSIVTRAGILMYVRISGDIVEKGYIGSFGGDKRFSWNLPLTFAVDFVNEGNVAVTPKGEIRVKNMFGATKATLPVNPYGGLVLPGSNGSFSSEWTGDGFFFGLYKAEITLSYAEDETVPTVSQIWYFVLISPLAGALVLLVIIILFIAPPVLRRYNRWIVKKAKQ